MRPDEHKAKESRRYQARKKQQGDATSAEVAAQRRAAAAKARDTGTSIAAIKRRNGELPSLQQPRDEREAELRARSRQFSRRKLVSNQYRYQEMTEQGNKKNTHDRIIHPAVNNWFSPFQKPWHIDEMEQDAEMGADRETTNLVAMLEKNGMDTSLLSKAKTPLNLWLRYIYIYTIDDTSGSNYFRFKEEQEWDTEPTDFERQDTYKNTFQVDFGTMESVLHSADTTALLDLREEDSELVNN